MSEVELAPVNPIKDRTNPRAIINLVSRNLEKAIDRIPESVWEMSEKELKKQFETSHNLDLLRRSFWREFDSAQAGKRNIIVSNVYSGICVSATWTGRIEANPFKLAYILTPPRDYQNQIEVLLDIATDQILEILELPNKRKDGSADPMLGNVKHRIWETLLDRAKGSVVARSESKVLQANVDMKEVKSLQIDDLTPDQIDDLLAKHEQKKYLTTREESDVIDVEAHPSTVEGSGSVDT